jgi:hypothetical protein
MIKNDPPGFNGTGCFPAIAFKGSHKPHGKGVPRSYAPFDK